MKGSALVRLIAGSIALLATGVWLGGIVVLGAIVAPTVFGVVPAPTSADAMTIVFVSFDRVAMTAAAIVSVAEVVRFRARGTPPNRVDGSAAGGTSQMKTSDVARLAVIACAGTLAVIQGLWLSPTIVALHRAGAIRGQGSPLAGMQPTELGQKLERFHSWSETCGKTESLLLVALVVLLAHALMEPPTR